jgi:hypothetical protein
MGTCASPIKSPGSSVPRCCSLNLITHRTLRTPSQYPAARSDGCRKRASAEARQDAIHPEGRFRMSVPLRWRPAHGCGSSKRAECQCLSGLNSCTLPASSRRSASMQARNQVIREQVQSSAFRTLTSPSKREMQPVFHQPPNPSIEGTASGLRPPAAPHVKR